MGARRQTPCRYSGHLAVKQIVGSSVYIRRLWELERKPCETVGRVRKGTEQQGSWSFSFYL